MEGQALVKVELFFKKDESGKGQQVFDRNGAETVILVPKAGSIPSKRVIAGSVAQRIGIFEGGLYLVDYTETAPTAENGRQFNWDKIMELEAKDYKTYREMMKDYGPAQIINVEGKVDAPVSGQIVPQGAITGAVNPAPVQGGLPGSTPVEDLNTLVGQPAAQ